MAAQAQAPAYAYGFGYRYGAAPASGAASPLAMEYPLFAGRASPAGGAWPQLQQFNGREVSPELSSEGRS